MFSFLILFRIFGLQFVYAVISDSACTEIFVHKYIGYWMKFNCLFIHGSTIDNVYVNETNLILSTDLWTWISLPFTSNLMSDVACTQINGKHLQEIIHIFYCLQNTHQDSSKIKRICKTCKKLQVYIIWNMLNTIYTKQIDIALPSIG